MNAETMVTTTRVVCPHCDAINRVPQERMTESPSCGACKRPLFEGHPVALTESNFSHHLKNSDLPLVVDFWAAWCAPCRAMAPVFERVAGALEPQARFVKIDTDQNQSLARDLAIRGIPTLAVFRNGVEVARTAGVMDAAGFTSWVRAQL